MTKKFGNRGRTERSNNSGELFGTILGMFGFRQHNICKSDDDTFYCKFMRFFQLFITILVLCMIIYVLKLLFTSKVKLFGGKIRK